MTERTRIGLASLGAAVALGVLGDLLLREAPWGLNWALWAAAAAVAAVALGARRPLLGLALLFSLLLLWRASPVLAALNLLASAGALALAWSPLRRGVLDDGVAGARLVANAGAGPLLTASEVDWSGLPRSRWSDTAGAAARGVAIAVPLLLLFGGLFVAADAVFEGFVRDLFDVGNPFTHVVVFLLWAWIGAGLLRVALVPSAVTERETAARFGRVEVVTALGPLVLLFLVFVLVQVRYLFGGEEHVLETTGLTYAEYARRGFFELVAVAALALPLVVAGDVLVRADARRWFRALALGLIALLAVVIVSALERMRLYMEAYGLTELRLFTTAFMLWLAAVLAWTVVTMFRNRRPWLATGGAAAAFAIILLLNVLNPDALIARTNIERHLDDGRPLDVSYLTGLSADAAPEVAARLHKLPRFQDRRPLETMITRGPWSCRVKPDWRTWNWSRARACARRS